jgi:hypothetical protein
MARRLLVLALFLACRPSGSASPRPAETVELPPAPPLVVDEGPVVYPTFDAGGSNEIAIPTVRCDETWAGGTVRIFPPPTWKVKVTPELLALPNPPSQLRVFISNSWILLGPVGFGCRATLLSSAGPALSVVPLDKLSAEPFQDASLDGELVRTGRFCWFTSGYWNAGNLASRIFPVTLHDRLQRFFAGNGFDPNRYFATGPYPGELVTVDGLHASYTDPAGVAGIAAEGTDVRPNGDPILGSLFEVGDPVHGGDAMEVLAVRLVAERDPLTAAIIADFDARVRDDRRDPVFEAIPRCTEGRGMWGPPCAR